MRVVAWEDVPEPSVTDDHPGYWYGLGQAVRLAAALDVSAISAVELGVARGDGLAVLQDAAATHSVKVSVTGFDSGAGMPPPQDYRDMPYTWQEGQFPMDEDRLRGRLRDGTELVLGDVAGTAAAWLAEDRAPLGFAAFDLDYYSSTLAALSGLLTGPAEKYLPRVICYFDDTVGSEAEMHSPYTGVLAAISEFNDARPHRKLARPNGLRWKLGGDPAAWIDGIYVLHLFRHPRYCDSVLTPDEQQIRAQS